jgi:phosphoribosyl 1,2-cyclic phosphodiesterase
MLIRFWGTRGSLPAPLGTAGLRRKLLRALRKAAGRPLDTDEAVERFVAEELDFATSHTFGGNTACVQIDVGGPEYVLCDLGSGARELGLAAMARYRPGVAQVFHVFLSHLHWDHIQGFPFFVPAYIPGNRIVIHGCHEDLEAGFRRQHGAPSFPVNFSQLPSTIEFVHLVPGETYEVAGLRVTAKRQFHSGDSYAYRFERDGKAVVYSTDSEHKLDDPASARGFADFFRDADLVIFDAMYSLADAFSIKEDWGHSSNIVGVELCQMAGVRHLCLFHHEPAYDDEKLTAIWRETERLEELTRGERPLRITAAYDGLELRV